MDRSSPFVVMLVRCLRAASWDRVAAVDVVGALLWKCLRRELVDSCGNGDACRNCNGDWRLAVMEEFSDCSCCGCCCCCCCCTAANAAKGFVLPIPSDGWNCCGWLSKPLSLPLPPFSAAPPLPPLSQSTPDRYPWARSAIATTSYWRSSSGSSSVMNSNDGLV